MLTWFKKKESSVKIPQFYPLNVDLDIYSSHEKLMAAIEQAQKDVYTQGYKFFEGKNPDLYFTTQALKEIKIRAKDNNEAQVDLYFEGQSLPKHLVKNANSFIFNGGSYKATYNDEAKQGKALERLDELAYFLHKHGFKVEREQGIEPTVFNHIDNHWYWYEYMTVKVEVPK